jgi:hypothetical protein
VSEDDKTNDESPRLTLALASESSAASDPMQAAEARMRRALGLNGERQRSQPERVDMMPRPMDRFTPAGGHKRRFVQDGEVPVTLVHGLVAGRRDSPEAGTARGAAMPTNRLEVAEQALASEIALREKVERALQEAQASVHDLRTKLGHAQLAQREATDALHREQENMVALREALRQAEERAAAATAAQAAAEIALAGVQHKRAARVVTEPAPRPEGARRRGRPPKWLVEANARAAAAAEAADVLDAEAEELLEPEALLESEALLDAEAQMEPVLPEAPAKKVKQAAPEQSTERKPRGRRPKSAEPAPAREPKPIRWWLTPKKTAKKR